MKRLARAAGVLAASLSLSAAVAGPVADFEDQFRAMYGDYRAALFMTNTGKQEPSAKAAGALEAAFTAISQAYGDLPPPQYADDTLWATTLADAGMLIEQARGEIAAGKLPEAHETLEGVRDLFGDLHVRNGVTTFSDRMNAYHSEMEHVLMADLAAADLGELREQAAVMDYLARDIVANPPTDATGNAEFDTLTAKFAASVDAFLSATRSGDPEQVKAAVAGLKKPYSVLFLKFG